MSARSLVARLHYLKTYERVKGKLGENVHFLELYMLLVKVN